MSLDSRVILIALDMKQFLQNYTQAPVSRLHSSSTSALSFIYFILISIHFSSTFLNRRPLCEVDLSSVIVTKGISVGISLAGLIARRYEIKNSTASYFNSNDHITLLAVEKLPKQNRLTVTSSPADQI